MEETMTPPPHTNGFQSKQRNMIAWVILALCAMVTLGMWNSFRSDSTEDARTRFDFRADQIQNAVTERMRAYEQILFGGAGLFNASPTPVTRSMWQAYVSNLHIEKNYPGVQGVGFAQHIRPEEKENHIQQVRAEGFPNYSIYPDGNREIYTSIVYLEPFSGRNLRAFGYDMFSEEVRRVAMEKARDSGNAAISGKVILVQETDKNIQNGFLIYVPIYKKGMPAQTAAERQAALLGYAYSPFRINDFLQGIFQTQPTDIDFEVYGGSEINDKSLLYASDRQGMPYSNAPTREHTPLFETTKTIAFQDQNWTLRFHSSRAFEATIDQHKPIIALILGSVFSLACFLIIHSAFITRQKALRIANEMTSALSESENRLKSMLDNTPSLVYMKHLDGRYYFINKQWALLFKTSNEALMGKLDSDFFPRNIAAAFMINDKQVIESGNPIIIEETAPLEDGPHTYMSVKFPLRDGEGNMYGLAGISTDISELKRATEEIRKLSQAIEQSPISIVITNSNGDIEYVNAKFMEITGYAKEEVIGKNPRILKSGAQSAEFYCNLWSQITSGEIWRGDFCNKKKNGEIFWEKAVISPIKNSNGIVTHYIGLKEDITVQKLMELDLKKTDERWRMALEGANDGLWDWNIKTGEVYFSPSWMAMLGYEALELEHHIRTWEKLVHPDDMPGVMICLNQHLKGKTPLYENEHRLRTKSGEWKWVLDRGKVFTRDADGTPLRAVGTHTDISQRKRDEEQLRKLSHAIKQSLSPVMITSRKGIIEYVNPKFEEITGYHSVEVLGMRASFLKSGYHNSEFYQRLWKTILSGNEFRAEFCNRKKNGELFWELQSISPIFDAHGNIENFISISIDDTERKKASEALKKSEAELQQHRDQLEELVKLRTSQLTQENFDRQQAEEHLARTLREQETIFSTNPDIIYVADLRTNLIKWNKRLEIVSEFPSEEIMGKKCVALFSPDDADLVANAIEMIMSEGKAEVEAHLLCKSGKLIPYHFNGVPLRNEQGGIIGFTGTGHDITERRQAEHRLKKIYEQLVHSEKLSALGKLTGSIAHEFNNPIYGLRNIIEQTREEEGLDEEIKELLDLAIRECDRMAGLVRKLQGFYKPSDDTRASVNIHQLLDDIEALTKKKLRVKGIQLIKNYASELPSVHIVEDQIKQVLLNLINNAEEAISVENGKITISTEVEDSNIKVHIQDTGEGIPDENLKLIFEPFFSTKGIKGTGLGLSVCYGIVQAHGGTLDVVSRRGEGTTFTLILPIGD